MDIHNDRRANEATIEICALGAVYGGDKPAYLRECLQSIKDQSISIPLFIVIDGPICKNLENELSEWTELNVNFIRIRENVGLAKALQKALEVINKNFSYVIRFDADDINHPSRFEVIINYLMRNDVDLVSSHMNEIDDDGNIFSRRNIPIQSEKIKTISSYRNPINHPAAAFKISSVLYAGGYKEMPFFEDWYLWCRMIKKGFMVENIDQYLVNFRATDEMISRRYGIKYLRHEANFFTTRHKEKLTPPIKNALAFFIRLITKIFGFKIYKKIFLYIRK